MPGYPRPAFTIIFSRLQTQLIESVPATPAPVSARLTTAIRAASPARWLAALLDAAIAVAALSLAVVVAVGPFDVGVLSASTAAKPILHLILLVPVRMAIGGPSWLAAASLALVEPARTRLRAWRIPVAIQDAAFALIVTRVAAIIIGFAANLVLFADRPRAFSVPLPWARFAETFAVFDSGWYFDIASRGYYFDASGQSSIAFFPLYPLLMRAAAAPFGGSDAAVWAAGIAISWAAIFGALVALHQLTEQMTGSRDVARRAVLYLAIFPFSFYFSRVYAESLFLLWAVLALSSAYRGRWAVAGLLGALAALTRSNGVLIALPLAVMAFGGGPAVRDVARRLLALAPIPLAVAAYSAYVYQLTGDALAWLDAQQHWGFSVGHMPYRHLLNSLAAIEQKGLYEWLTGSATAPIDFFYTVVALLFLALVPAVVRTFGAAFGLYVLIGLAVPLSANVMVSIGRYASVLFPVFMVAATVTSPRAHTAILVVSALFYTLFMILFIGWYPLH